MVEANVSNGKLFCSCCSGAFVAVGDVAGEGVFSDAQ